MSGYVGDLSPSQEEALKEFRQILSDVLKPKHDDHLLLQFLRARRFDLKKSEEMFRRHLEFRKKFDEDYFLNEYKPPELLVQYLLPSLLGYDKGGSPVRVVYAGPCDIKGLVSCYRREELKKCITWFLDKDKEAMKMRSKETGIHVETRTFVFDLNGLSLRQIYHRDVYEMVIAFLKLYEGNYPENLKVAFVINTPSFFAWMYNMIKSLLSEDTVKKVKIYGYSGWKEDLLEAIDAEVLPVIYGGTRTDEDGDPRCRNLIPQGGPIPTKYYLKNQQRLSQDDENVQKVTISRRSKHNVPLTVEVAGSTICWEVDCKRCDISLYVVYHGAGTNGTAEVVVEPTKISDAFGVEKGYFLAEKVGKCPFIPEMWNHHANYGSRTTNHIEGWHHALNTAIGRKHIDIYQFVKHLKNQQELSEQQMVLLDAGNRPPRIKKVYLQNNDKIMRLTSSYINHEITLESFSSSVSYSSVCSG